MCEAYYVMYDVSGTHAGTLWVCSTIASVLPSSCVPIDRRGSSSHSAFRTHHYIDFC